MRTTNRPRRSSLLYCSQCWLSLRTQDGPDTSNRAVASEFLTNTVARLPGVLYDALLGACFGSRTNSTLDRQWSQPRLFLGEWLSYVSPSSPLARRFVPASTAWTQRVLGGRASYESVVRRFALSWGQERVMGESAGWTLACFGQLNRLNSVRLRQRLLLSPSLVCAPSTSVSRASLSRSRCYAAILSLEVQGLTGLARLRLKTTEDVEKMR